MAYCTKVLSGSAPGKVTSLIIANLGNWQDQIGLISRAYARVQVLS